jgi:endonuclease G
VAAAATTPKPAPAPKTGATQASRFRGREGYQADFLGDGALAVPLPGLGPRASDVAPVSDDPSGVLKYRHFSVIQSASRRLPMLTAVNIDGARAVMLKRKGDWRLDGRLSADHQIGDELYASNPLDRGHMVRRNDPGWGPKARAQQGESDTFHYTNAAPQHERLNQREWVGLEDYILQNARTRDFKACVFTGPVFRDDDRRLKAGLGSQDAQIPEEFWKVAVMVNADTGALSATGYVLSHGPMIRDLVEAAFVYGEYKTYQVRIDRIGKATGFDFGALCDHDPLARPGVNEAVFGEAALAIGGPDDLRL